MDASECNTCTCGVEMAMADNPGMKTDRLVCVCVGHTTVSMQTELRKTRNTPTNQSHGNSRRSALDVTYKSAM